MSNTVLHDLVTKCIKGDKASFVRLCEYKARDVLYICTMLMGNPHDGEDAAQEVFIKLQRNISQVKNPEKFNAWLNRIISTTCANLRRSKHKIRLDQPLDAIANLFREDNLEFLPSEFAEQKEMQNEVIAGLQSLPYKYQEALLMFYFEGLSLREIAEALDTTEKAAKALVHRSRQALKRKLVQNNSLDSQAALPVAGGVSTLTRIFQQQAQASISQDSITNALVHSGILGSGVAAASAAVGSYGAAGTAAAGTAAATGATTVAGAAAASAAAGTTASFALGGAAITGIVSATAAVLIGGAVIIGGSTFDSSPVDVAESASLHSVPQHYDLDSRPGGHDPDVLYSSSMLPETQDSALANAGSEASVPAEGLPGTAGSSMQVLQGSVVFVDMEGHPLQSAGSYAAGSTVSLYLGDTLKAQATVQDNGDYALQYRPAGTGEYHLVLELQPVYGLQYAYPHTDGIYTWNAGETPPDQLFITDTLPPTGSIRLYDANGEDMQGGVLNPTTAGINASDQTELTIAWRVEDDQGTALLKGRGDTAPLADCPAKPGGGWYTVYFLLTDAAGNTSEIQRQFFIL